MTVVFPPRLRPESDRNFFHLLVVKRWRRNNNRSYEPTPPDTVSVETCISFLKNIDRVVIQLFIRYFFKNKHLLCLCVHGLEGIKK